MFDKSMKTKGRPPLYPQRKRMFFGFRASVGLRRGAGLAPLGLSRPAAVASFFDFRRPSTLPSSPSLATCHPLLRLAIPASLLTLARVATPGLWLGFFAGILLLLGMDLGLSGRRGRDVSFGEAAAWSAIWVAASLGFNLFLWLRYGAAPALEFFTGYLIEKSLSLDNLLLFVLLFRYFAVEPRYQHRVLYWGVFGALAMRGGMIGAGVLLIERFHWMFELLGAFLVFAGLRMLFRKSGEAHPEQNSVFRWARKFLPFTESYEGSRFFVRAQGVWRATPLLLVLLGVEAFDLIFALDSIPAVLGITRDPFIVFSSNACAVLGLRSLYFLLAGALPRFRYLGTGISLILLFIGVKMLGARWMPISTPISLLVVAAIVAGSIGASLAGSRPRLQEWGARPAKARTSVKD